MDARGLDFDWLRSDGDRRLQQRGCEHHGEGEEEGVGGLGWRHLAHALELLDRVLGLRSVVRRSVLGRQFIGW